MLIGPATPTTASSAWGYDALHARIERDGRSEAHRWWQPARVHGVQRVLDDHRGHVIALGAGHTHFEDVEHLDQVAAALAPFDDVILLTAPLDVLRQRCIEHKGRDWLVDGRDWLAEWHTSEQSRLLATHIVDTAGRTPAGVVDAIVRR